MKNSIKTIIIVIGLGCLVASCDSYLDVVPDNIATIDNAFTDKNQAEKYLYTLYSYLPKIGHPRINDRFDDLTWTGLPDYNLYNMYHARLLYNGDNAFNPYCNNWEGLMYGTPLFQAIRNCNVLLEKIDQVRDLDSYEKYKWIAETKFLKAYFHFLLLQQYGPIPIVDINLPVASSDDEVMVERCPVDMVFDYIINLIDEAIPNLPLKIEDVAIEMGRITQCAALAMKAKIAVTAASPFFNGNTTYASFKNLQGQPFFGDYDSEKWTKAVDACKQAIDACHNAEYGLYEYDGGENMSVETQKIVQVGRIITDRWNKEHVWGMVWLSENGLIDEYTGGALSVDHNSFFRGIINPTIKAAELFYSKNGVPIEEDRFYDYENRYNTVQTVSDDNKYVQTGVQTAQLNLNREYRFYGSIAFDGGWWYGLGRYTETNQWPVNSKTGGASGQRGSERFSCTGMFIKKLINVECSFNNTTFVYVRSDYPILRLADLYLLYAEALNEHLDAPNAEVWEYVNLVRERAGLESVQDAWTKYSNNPDKYATKQGMRDIIRQERSIELAFECHRFLDIRRWNTAVRELTGPVQGWNIMGQNSEDFYQVISVANLLFTDRDMLSPIRTAELTKNHNLVQNPGW